MNPPPDAKPTTKKKPRKKTPRKKTPRKKTPPKKFDRPAYFKQWDSAIGPLVRLVDKIGHGVGEHNSAKQKKVEKCLHDATDAMEVWMGVEE